MKSKKVESTLTRIDRDTLEKLRRAAGGKPVAAYLRDIADGSPPPTSVIRTRLDKIVRDLDDIGKMISGIEKTIRAHGMLFDYQAKNNPGLRKYMDEVYTHLLKEDVDENELDALLSNTTDAILNKLDRLGIDADAEILKAVNKNPALLDDKAWIKTHQVGGDLTDIETWKKDFKDETGA